MENAKKHELTPAAFRISSRSIITQVQTRHLELGVAGLLLAQENMEGDARESDRLKQDSTCRIKIHAEGDDPGSAELSIPLARNGPRCQFKLIFPGEIMRFESSKRGPGRVDRCATRLLRLEAEFSCIEARVLPILS